MIMDQKLSEADVWEDQAPSAKTWLVTQAKAITSDPAQWTALHEVSGPHDPKFWNGDALNMKTLTVLELLRDALAHWNVATSDNSMRHFNDKYAMNRFFFYRAKSARGPWDVISMPAESFLTFLKGWAALLSGGEGRERLRSREALASSEKNTA